MSRSHGQHVAHTCLSSDSLIQCNQDIYSHDIAHVKAAQCLLKEVVGKVKRHCLRIVTALRGHKQCLPCFTHCVHALEVWNTCNEFINEFTKDSSSSRHIKQVVAEERRARPLFCNRAEKQGWWTFHSSRYFLDCTLWDITSYWCTSWDATSC